MTVSASPKMTEAAGGQASAINQEGALSWNSLLHYYSLCIEHEGAFDELLQRSAAGTNYVFVQEAAENLISWISSDLNVDERTRSLAQTALEKGETLYYGYPTVLITEELQDARGRVQSRRKLGALFLVEVALPLLGQPIPAQLPVKTDVPFLHPGVLSRFGFKEEQLLRLVESFPIEPHLGSHAAVRQYMSELVEEIGIPTTANLDPQNLGRVGEGEIEGVGLHNVPILFRARSSQYSQGLLTEIRELRSRWHEAKHTSAGLFFGARDESSSPVSPSSVSIAAPLPINESQEKALAQAMTARLTVITGPPGTGKSQLITNAVATAWIAKQSVLVASTNNQAVNVVCERASKIWPGLIIRTGAREYRDSARELLAQLLHGHGTVPDIRALLASLEKCRSRVLALRGLVQERSSIETRLGEVHLGRETLCADLGWSLNDLPPTLTGHGLNRRRRQARRLLRARFFRTWRLRRFLRAMNLDSEDLIPLVVQFLDLEEEWRSLIAREERVQPMDSLWRDLINSEADFRAASERAVKAGALSSLRSGRSAISKFVQARYRFGEENPVAAAFSSVLPYVRAWATTSLSVKANMPLQPGLFDLVIIDEASQCSIPATIPLLYRAKRALIIGDPMQLAHISTLSRSEEDARLETSGLNRQVVEQSKLGFRRHSIYHALEGHTFTVHLLDEHYRSHPKIIELSNKLFYGGRLTILTNPAQLIDFGEHAVAWRDVGGHAVRPDSGSAMNEQEAKAVAEEVRHLLSRDSFQGSVGVVTPFSAQARLIGRLVEVVPDKVRTERKLIIGTAHRFQGDERDVIIFSPVASQGIAESSLRWLLGTSNLFNVAITRARSYLLVVGNRRYCEESTGVLGQLATYVRETETAASVEKAGSEGNLHSEAEVRVYRALLDAGLNVSPKAVVRGYECDFVVKGKNSVINLECDGRTHTDQLGRLRRQDRVRDQLLAAQGWNVVRIPAWRCLLEPAAVAREVSEGQASAEPS